MWDRKDLKEKGKSAFRANRLTCIIAALLLLVTGATGGLGAPSVTNHFSSNDSEYEDNFDSFDVEDGITDGFDDEFLYEDPDGYSEATEGDSSIPPVMGIILAIIILVGVTAGILISVLVLNPLLVGVRKFFIDNSGNPSTGLSRDNIGVAFSNNYKNIVVAMFTTGFFTFLWTLLLIVPGLIKGYEWRMVPYLLSENPDMRGDEARAMSSEMMYGSKMDAFVLDLSFIGWLFLGALTFGILNLVWTHPYEAATDAELYLALKEIHYPEQTEEITSELQ